MGLDCIPRQYACKKLGTAILDEEGRVKCSETQEKDLCPWKSQLAVSGVEQRVVLGMFGTDCWYRGKYAQALINEYDAPFDFYGVDQGEDEDGNEEIGLDSDQCLEMAEWMKDQVDLHDEYSKEDGTEWEYREDWLYIAWWLEFVANNCDGYYSWY
jgi:hypothetical protein